MPTKKTTTTRTTTRRAAPEPATTRARGTGAAVVYEALRDDILNLKIAPGTLLDEIELGRRFQLSRSPVREALIRLSAEGLIQTQANRSPLVTPFDIAQVPGFLDAMELMYRVTSRLAAMNRTPVNLREIVVKARQLERGYKDKEVVVQMRENRAFHMAVAEAGGNPVYTAWLGVLLDQGQRLFRLCAFFEGDKSVRADFSEHHAIVAAVEAQDALAAEQAGVRDLDILRNRLMREFGARPTGSMQLRSSR
ncbi:MAG: GntR family transcriptional regulator [Proteobacteria bacterium]|nr:GntR family transcriptional regulator [Pseudomonadota bacterium]